MPPSQGHHLSGTKRVLSLPGGAGAAVSSGVGGGRPGWAAHKEVAQSERGCQAGVIARAPSGEPAGHGRKDDYVVGGGDGRKLDHRRVRRRDEPRCHGSVGATPLVAGKDTAGRNRLRSRGARPAEAETTRAPLRPPTARRLPRRRRRGNHVDLLRAVHQIGRAHV